MEKKIEQFLHLYLGCDVTHAGGKTGKLVSVGISGSIIVYPDGDQRGNFIMSEVLKPILRPLSSMTEEELLEVLNFMEARSQSLPKLIRRMRVSDDFEKREWAQWYFINPYSKEDLDKEIIVANLSNGENGLSICNGNNYYRCYLKTIPYLISKGFDLFGLIESNLAVEKK